MLWLFCRFQVVGVLVIVLDTSTVQSLFVHICGLGQILSCPILSRVKTTTWWFSSINYMVEFFFSPRTISPKLPLLFPLRNIFVYHKSSRHQLKDILCSKASR